VSRHDAILKEEPGLRLTFVLLTWFSLSSATAATQWIAHYVPVGGPSGGLAQGLAVDSSGNIFVSAIAESSGRAQTCLFKLDAQGNLRGEICFGFQAASSAVAVGPDGNPVVAGITYFPGSVKLVSPLISQTFSSEAGYVIKFNSDLTAIIFSTLVGGTTAGSLGAGTVVSALALDQAGNIYIGGWTADGNFPLTAGAFQSAPPIRAIPAFVTAISSAGDRILWSTLLGGQQPPCTECNAGMAAVSGLAVDSTGAVVIFGSATGEQMPVTAGVIGSACLCTVDTPAAFLAKLTSGGSQLAWATYVNYASVTALALDAADDVIIGGQAYTGFTTTSGALQTVYPGGPQTQSGSNYDQAAGFVAKIDPSATRYLFATWLGGNNFQESISTYEILEPTNGVTGLALDAAGTIWATGGSLPSELPLPASTPIFGSNYVLGLSPDGSEMTAATTAPEGGAGLGIAISPQGPVALGKSGSTLIPVSAMPALAGIASSAGITASGSVSPNELISFYGEGLGPSTALSGVVRNGVLTNSLGGVQVEFDGVAAPLLYAGPNQINAVVPSGIAGQTSTTVTIVTPMGQITGLVLSVVPSIPEVFTYPPPGNAARALNSDGTLNSVTNPAAPGSVVAVWATGGGASGNPEADGAITGATVYPLSLPLSVGTGFPGAVSVAPVLNPVSAPQVQYSGDAPGLVKGEIQVNFQIPPQAAGAFQFYLQVGYAVSDPFTVYVQ
jgi:uncharacterized protein (TIGR03437 family)